MKRKYLTNRNKKEEVIKNGEKTGRVNIKITSLENLIKQKVMLEANSRSLVLRNRMFLRISIKKMKHTK
jgi:hypothetical protein